MRKYIICLIFVCMVTGCTANKTDVNYLAAVVEPAGILENANAEKEEIIEKYALLYEISDYKLALYEPKQSCYIGADIVRGRKISTEISEFEAAAKKSHGIYVNSINIDDTFPLNWVLDCIANMRTPLIIIEPVKDSFDMTSNYLEKLARDCGEYYVPMFVAFLPAKSEYNADKYVALYKKAYEIFKKKASNVALVWSIDAYDVYESEEYYPGDEYVDWIGLNIFQTFTDEGKYRLDVIAAIDFAYFRFQKSKPIMISQLAISHYSSNDHIYRISPAALELQKIYKEIDSNYSRIKGVVYEDINSIDAKIGNDNFSVTDNGNLLQIYADSISHSKFVSELELSVAGDYSREIMRSPFAAYKINNEYFVSENTISYDLNIRGASSYGEKRIIDGQVYYNAKIFDNTLKKVTCDDLNKRIVISHTS